MDRCKIKRTFCLLLTMAMVLTFLPQMGFPVNAETDASAHTHNYKSIVTAPTCTEQGYTTLVCTACGDTKLETQTVDITDLFTWTSGKMIIATTGACQDYAYWQASDYVDISAFDSITIKTANTISVNTTTGLAFYDVNKKYISGVTHTDGVGKEYGTLTHILEIPENAVYIRSTWYAASHPNYSSAFGEFSCTATGQHVPATGHSYELASEIPPVCTAQGTYVYTCSDCGDSYTETVNRAEHTYDNGVCTVCGVSILGSDWIAPDFAEGDYTMVVLPDTQILVQYWPEIYYNQMQWIADNKEELNIQAVLHMGDMVNNNNDTEWTVCETGTDILDTAGIPWMPMRGNHDDSAWFNRYYDYETYGTNHSWFGGSYEAGKLDHTYWFVTAGSREYMILSLGWAPSWDVLNWAQGIVEENSDKSVILACHAYMNKDGSLLAKGDSLSASTYIPGYPSGEDVWNAFKSYGNVVLAMGGHVHSADLITWVGQNGAGQDVASLLVDRQDDDTKNRYAMVALLTFHADSETVDVNWYSTRYDALFRAKNQFSITVPGVCEHNYTSAIVKPTCTESGGTKYTCSICNHSYWENPESALGHSYENNVCATCGIIRVDMTEQFTKWTTGGPVLFRNGYGYGEEGFPDGSNPNLKYSDYISVEGIDTLELTVCARKGHSATGGYAFYTDKGVEYFISEGASTRNGNGAAAEGTVIHTIAVPEEAKYIRVSYWVDSTSYAAAVPFSCVGYQEACLHDFKNGTCTLCGAEHPNLANYEGKVISILGASICTFDGYIPVADGFNLQHVARYPQDNLLTDVNDTWWMQIINGLDAKLGINDSWRSTEVYNACTDEVNSSYDGTKACLSSVTRIQNLGSNGTPDVILFFGGTNDITQRRPLGNFDPNTAPTEADLTSETWETVTDAYVALIMRLQHYYPDSQIVVMLPYSTSSNSDAVTAEYTTVFAAICQHYGVTCVDLMDCGISTSDLPDGTHPDAEGMDYLTNAVLETLLSECEMEPGENVVHSVKHELTGAESALGYYKGISHGKSFVTAITGEDMTVIVTMGGVDITASAYRNGTIDIASVTGDVVITASGRVKNVYEDYLQQLPEDICAGTNIWAILDPVNEYYTATGWGNNSNSNYSVTIPVTAGDRIWATSFGAAGTNGYSADAVRITWFSNDGVLESLDRSMVYVEFTKHGYVTVPEGAVALNVPMASNADTWELYILNREHSYENGTCTLCGAEDPDYILPGDLDRDGEISDWDAILLNRYLAGWNVTIDLKSADVDNDGEVSDWDAILLERFLAGWNISLE